MRGKRINPVSDKTRKRNAIWKKVCLERAMQLEKKYGVIICEYSGEAIRTLSSTGDDMNDGWGHHIDRNRNNTDISNCYIVKFKYHSEIHNKNIVVSSEDFGTRELFL